MRSAAARLSEALSAAARDQSKAELQALLAAYEMSIAHAGSRRPDRRSGK